MEIGGIQEQDSSWPLEQQGMLGLSPKNDFMDYLVPLLNSDVSVTLNYTRKEFDKDQEK